MTTQAFIILTETEAAAAVDLNPEEGVEKVSVWPRVIDNPTANNLGEGVLVGKFVLPARILNNLEYSAWHPTLSVLPIRTMDSDVLFLPDPEV